MTFYRVAHVHVDVLMCVNDIFTMCLLISHHYNI